MTDAEPSGFSPDELLEFARRRPAPIHQVTVAIDLLLTHSRLVAFCMSERVPAGTLGVMMATGLMDSIDLRARSLAHFFLAPKSIVRSGRSTIHWSMLTETWVPPNDAVTKRLRANGLRADQIVAHMLDHVQIEAQYGFMLNQAARDVVDVAARFAAHLIGERRSEGRILAGQLKISLGTFNQPDSYFEDFLPQPAP